MFIPCLICIYGRIGYTHSCKEWSMWIRVPLDANLFLLIIMKVLDNYYKAFEKVVKKFTKTYHSYEDGSIPDYYIIGSWKTMWPDTVQINDDWFWNIEDMYTALLNNIPEDKLFEWYDYSLEMATLGKEYDILYQYVYWSPKYSIEEIKKIEEDVSHAEALFMSEIDKYIENTKATNNR